MEDMIEPHTSPLEEMASNTPVKLFSLTVNTSPAWTCMSALLGEARVVRMLKLHSFEALIIGFIEKLKKLEPPPMSEIFIYYYSLRSLAQV